MRDEILKMDDRELYEELYNVLDPDEGPTIRRHNEALHLADNKKDALWACYQAEEKLDSMGLKAKRGEILCELVADVSHAHPKLRAQAILMTIGGEDE